MRVARRSVAVRSTDLGPGLLKQHDPNFVILGLAEDRPETPIENRNHIIYDDFLELPLRGHLQPVDPLLADFHFVAEYLPDAAGHLSNRRDGGQEITIAHIALLDVIRVDVVFHHHCVFNDIRDAPPDDFPVVDLNSH